MALPNEMARYLPASYWNRTRDRWPMLDVPVAQLMLDTKKPARLLRQAMTPYLDLTLTTSPPLTLMPHTLTLLAASALLTLITSLPLTLITSPTTHLAICPLLTLMPPHPSP